MPAGKHEWSSILSSTDPICTKCTFRRSAAKDAACSDVPSDPIYKLAVEFAEALVTITNAWASKPKNAQLQAVWIEREMEPAIETARRILTKGQ